jgi:hypothetical protein
MYVTGRMLQLVYQQQGNNDAWEAIHRQTPEITHPNFGKEFLPIATILDEVANDRYELWESQNEANNPKANTTIDSAAEYELLAFLIRKANEANLGKSDRILAGTESFLALMLTKSSSSADFAEQVDALYGSAEDRYKIAETREKDRSQNSEQFSLLGGAEKAAPRESDDVLVMQILRAKRNGFLGDYYHGKGNEAEAKKRYAQSQQLYEEVLTTMQSEWKLHPNTIYQEYNLADILDRESVAEGGAHDPAKGREHREAAIEHMREVVKYYDAHHEVYSGWLKESASKLAAYLDADGKKSEAAAIREKYKLSK